MAANKKKIVLITSGHPAANPRIVKEAQAFHDAGHEVTLLYCYLIEWATREEEQLFHNVKWKHLLIGGSPGVDKITFHFTRLRQKVSSILSKRTGNNKRFAERVQARCYDELLIAAKSIKADWYIGHNLGTIAVCVHAAKANGAYAGFDFEDYHRGELSEEQSNDLERVKFLENKYVPGLSYISTASPLISKAVEADFPMLKVPVATILNVFPKERLVAAPKLSGSGALKLVWFSQTIGRGRGLEYLFQALIQLNDPNISLTLVGRMDPIFGDLVAQTQQITKCPILLQGVVPPQHLEHFCADFDIGLALETGFSKNNAMALSNKIFTYLHAGLAIIFFATSMQQQFNDEFHCGRMVAIGDVDGLCKAIRDYFDAELLMEQKKNNLRLACNRLNWAMESERLLAYFEQQNLREKI